MSTLDEEPPCSAEIPVYVVGDFDADQWEDVYPLVDAILEPGIGHAALKPMLGPGHAKPTGHA